MKTVKLKAKVIFPISIEKEVSINNECDYNEIEKVISFEAWERLKKCKWDSRGVITHWKIIDD